MLFLCLPALQQLARTQAAAVAATTAGSPHPAAGRRPQRSPKTDDDGWSGSGGAAAALPSCAYDGSVSWDGPRSYLNLLACNESDPCVSFRSFAPQLFADTRCPWPSRPCHT